MQWQRALPYHRRSKVADPKRPACVQRCVTRSALLYDANGSDKEIALSAEHVRRIADDQLLWIDVQDSAAGVAGELARALDIPARSIERVIDRDRPRYLDNYASCFAFALDLPVDMEKPGARGKRAGPQVGFVVGGRYLLTIHEEPIAYLSEFKAQDKGETQIGTLSPALLAASLLDWHLTRYFAEVAEIESAVDSLDESILADGTQREVLDKIVAIRVRVSGLRAQLAAQRPIFYGFSRPDFSLNFDEAATRAFARLSTRYDRAIDEVERTRDVVVGSFELFTSMTTQQTNDLVKALTFLTAVIGFCAAVAGLLGMNFELAIFKTGLAGFEIVTGGLLAVAVASLFVARWRRWV